MRQARKRPLRNHFEVRVTSANLDANTIPDADIQRDCDRISAVLGKNGTNTEVIDPRLRADIDRVHVRYGRLMQALADERDRVDDD